MRCFMCLEYVPYSDGDTEKIKEHITTVHCAECNVETLVEMCGEAEEREEREGWSLDDIIEEKKERREAAEKRRAESGGLMRMLRRLLGNSDRPDRDAGSHAYPKNVESDCFLCLEKFYLHSNVYNKHLEEKHMMIFGLKEITESVDEEEEDGFDNTLNHMFESTQRPCESSAENRECVLRDREKDCQDK